MKLLIAGSRSITDYRFLQLCFDQTKIQLRDIEYIISGGADGVDTLARLFSLRNDIPIKEFIPNWKLGPRAGYDRNTLMVNEADEALILWDGESRGTKDTHKKCLAKGIKTHLFTDYTHELLKEYNRYF